MTECASARSCTAPGLEVASYTTYLVMLLFGGAAIPKLARNLGSAKNQFEKGLDKSTTVVAPAPVVPVEDAMKGK